MRIECGGLTFISDFDSGNLDRVEFLSECIRSSATEKSSSSSSSSPSYFHNADAEKAVLRSHIASEGKGTESKKIKNASYASHAAPLPKSSPLRKAALLSNPSPTFKKKNVKVLEFRVWTKPDCGGTPFENQFRSWFYFGVEGGVPGCILKIHVVNLNRQGKLYFYGMRPVYKVLPGKDAWKRIPSKVHHKSETDGSFSINFSHPLPAKHGSVVYFAFTYPFTYSACQAMLDDIDKKVGSSLYSTEPKSENPENSIYYARELLCHSLDGRCVEVLTVTSFKGFTKEREERLPHLFPDQSKPRCHIFCDKKVIFISSRVHPGETPSSFVFNGFLRNLLCPKDYKANKLRNLFVFKLIPMLNPDGVWRGHFRTDSRGVNLNRTYLIASPELHPSVHAARSLLLYYHVLYSSSPPSASSTICMQEMSKDSSDFALQNTCSEKQKGGSGDHKVAYKPMTSVAILKASSEIRLISPASSTASVRHSAGGSLSVDTGPNLSDSVAVSEAQLDRSLSVSDLCCLGATSESNYSSDLVHNISVGCNSLNCSESWRSGSTNEESPKQVASPPGECPLAAGLKAYRSFSDLENSDADEGPLSSSSELEKPALSTAPVASYVHPDKSGLSYYIDLHGHACKRGCFIYGNYFSDMEQKVECMMLAKLLSINSPYFDFAACNFSAENMRSGSKREGQSKEGSGRVALYTFTGLIHSYTLECNYNTGRSSTVYSMNTDSVSPEKSVEYFSPEIYEQVGEALLVSILDATGLNPHSKVPRSSFGSLQGVREWLRKYALSVHTRNKNNFLKKNMLNASLSKVNPKDKSAFSSPALSAKFSNKGSLQKHELRGSCMPSNIKRNIHSPPVSNEKFLSDFGLKYKRLHASSPSLDHFKTTNKCLDSLKSLLNPKSKPFTAPKSTPLGTHPRKCKMGRMSADKAPREPAATEAPLAEGHRKSRNILAKNRSVDRMSDDVKGKKVMTAGSTSRKAPKPKKKGSLSSLPSTEPTSSSLLKSDGNLRLKKISKKSEKS